MKSSSCCNLDIGECSFSLSPRSVASSGTSQYRSASKLRQHLVSFDISSWRDKVTNLLVIGGSALSLSTNCLQPTGPGGCDHNPLDRCCNCATSLPVALVGLHAVRARTSKAGKLWGASLVGVGAASTAFHSSSGSVRPLCRRLDFWSIGCSSSLMVRAVFPNTPQVVTALGVALTPFKPYWVSFANSILMEYKFIKRAKEERPLRRYQKLHAATSLVGISCYAIETRFPQLPLIHSFWHCLSAASLCTVNHLVDSVERHELRMGQHEYCMKHQHGALQQHRMENQQQLACSAC